MALLLRQSGSASANLFKTQFSCPYGFVGASPLPLVASQARLESNVLDPQPGVTAGTRRMFQALGGLDRCPAVPSVSR